MTEVIEVEYNGLKVVFEPGERATGKLALAMLLQSGLVPEPSSFNNGNPPISSPVMPPLPSPISPTTPTTPTSPNGTHDVEVLDHGCSLGSCTHLLAALYQARQLEIAAGGRLYLTAVETPEDFRHVQSKGLKEKIEMYGWDNVRVMQGEMKVSIVSQLSPTCQHGLMDFEHRRYLSLVRILHTSSQT